MTVTQHRFARICGEESTRTEDVAVWFELGGGGWITRRGSQPVVGGGCREEFGSADTVNAGDRAANK